MKDRKLEHISLASNSKVSSSLQDKRFYYEPILGDNNVDFDISIKFLGKSMKAPMWVSSMTGGSPISKKINHNLAKVCNKFGIGMGLGSCRMLLSSNKYFEDFNVRSILGANLPLFANIGIAQLENLVDKNQTYLLEDLIEKLQADGIIIHVNPIQEYLQPKGDILKCPPIDTLERFLDKTNLKVIVKEVGQGMGPQSLKRLLMLPLAAIEFGAFGGTNFAKLETIRDGLITQAPFTKKNAKADYKTPTFLDEINGENSIYDTKVLNNLSSLVFVGHTAEEMVNFVNDNVVSLNKQVLCKEIIVSGGIGDFLDGLYLIKKSKLNAIYGQASAFLKYSMLGYEELEKYVQQQIENYKFASKILQIR